MRKILELGKKLEGLEEALKVDSARVAGCQSLMYLVMEVREGRVYYRADSDAFVSRGLAYIATFLLSGETPEFVLKQSRDMFAELGIPSLLSPSRANGLYSLHLKMQQEALQALVSRQA